MKKIAVAALAGVLGFTGVLVALAYHEAGDHAEDSAIIKISECPVAVQRTLLREARGVKIESVELGTVDLQVAFTAHTTIEGKPYLIQVRANGLLAAKTLDEDTDKTETVPLSACPVAVQKTLAREADGALIKSVSKSSAEGHAAYKATVKTDGAIYDINVTAEGLLTSKDINEDEPTP